jgi:hypothetical protein
MTTKKTRKPSPTVAPILTTIIQMGAGIVRGLDPDQVAEKVEAATRARGGNPVDLWRTVRELAGRRLELLDDVRCTCDRREAEPSRCVNCHGLIPRHAGNVVDL